MNFFYKGKYISKVLSCNILKGFKKLVIKFKYYSKFKLNLFFVNWIVWNFWNVYCFIKSCRILLIDK